MPRTDTSVTSDSVGTHDLHTDANVPTASLPGYDEWVDAYEEPLTESEEREIYDSYIASLIRTHVEGGTLLPGELELIRGRIDLIA
jgi:5-methylcytosine-specific restriction endonuclease McrBC GTP-binding regulatory subunit McrB